MKVVRCNDDTYSLILEHAAQRGCNITRAVDELVTGQLSSEQNVQSSGDPEELRTIVRGELRELLSVLLRLEKYVGHDLAHICFDAAVDANAICHKLGIETEEARSHREGAERGN